MGGAKRRDSPYVYNAQRRDSHYCWSLGVDNKLGLSWPDRFNGGSRNRGSLSINHMEMKLVRYSSL